MPDLQEQVQTTLGSGYSVERELGGGGMARVFLATESRLSRRVVVKVLRPEIAASTSTDRFEREMSLCARCQHPHIVPLLTAGHVGELPYFTMPFVEGESLRARLAREGPLPIDETVRLLTEIADALAYAHRQGVIHRDIKPENLLMQDGHAVVADFGVAKALDLATGAGAPGAGSQVTGVGMVIGTPAYMAPEQAVGDPGVNHRVDLYALGVVGYELITGQPPFGALTPPALVAAQLSRTPAPATRARPDCPPALATLIARLLAVDPAARPASGEEVRDALQAIGESLRGSRHAGRRARVMGSLLGGAAILGVGLLLLLRGGTRSALPPPAPAGPAVIRSLAVMPFQNIGGDSTSDYFSQGLAEELINALGKLSGLRVSSRTSSFAARAATTDLKEIGRHLDVGAILEATVQHMGQRVRVTARLVDVARDAQLWSGDYQSELRDVFAVQDTIARAIAEALKVTLAGARAGASLVERGTRDQEAHDRYLRGRFFLAQRTETAGHKAIEAFEGALARDSTYAQAYAGLADAYALLVPFGGMTPSIGRDRARSAALRAMALDSSLAEVHTSLGFIGFWLDWDIAGAERQYDRAIQLNPNYVPAYLFKSWLLAATGRTPQSLAAIEMARTLDPLSLIVNARLGTMLHFAGRDSAAIPAYRHALELDSTLAVARAGLALSLATLGRCAEAVAIAVPVEANLGSYESGEPGVVLAMCGKPAEARHALDALEALRRHRYVAADGVAAILTALGRTDEAFGELSRAVEERAFTMPMALVEPMFVPLHQDPRWSELQRRMGVRR